MRYFILLTIFVFQSTISFAQALDYDHLALLFSNENYQGTARFNAMGGAFGALGGDISATYINPASGAVFNHNEFSGSLQSNTISTSADYYGTDTHNEFTKLHAPQWGTVFVFDNFNTKSSWHKFALAFNYSMQQNFNNNYSANGNNANNFATFINHPHDTNNPKRAYLQSLHQSFTNDTRGLSEVYTFSFSAAYENMLYIGASINTHAFDFIQEAFLQEDNTDLDGNKLFADFIQYQSQIGRGISAGIGIIAKPDQSVRLGLSYQTPVWYYDIQEETNINEADGFAGETYIEASNIPTLFQNNPEYNNYNYTLRTPSKTTFSAAVLFNKYGLISLDYSLRNFQNAHLDDDDNTFVRSNDNLNTFANDQSNILRIGSEWRLKQWRFRGGYTQQKSLFINEPDHFDTQGYSFGLGFQFKNAKVDLFYQRRENEDLYDFYREYDQINAAHLNIENTTFGLTVSFFL